MSWDETYDVVVVGSGASGLTAAITAARRGLSVVVLEKASVWGGTTALSGGGLWVPTNRYQRAAGVPDTLEAAEAYLDEISNPADDPTDRPKRRAMLEQGPHLVDMLTEAGFAWTSSPQPDYRAASHAGLARGLDMEIADGRRLGANLATMRRSGAPFAIMIKDIPKVSRAFTSLTSIAAMARVFLGEKLRRAKGWIPLGCGESLIGQLRMIADQLGIEVRLNSPIAQVVIEDGRATGVVLEGGQRIGGGKALFLCAGGFAHADAMRTDLQGIDGAQSSASRDDTGDIIRMADSIGAKTAMLDAAWWGTAFAMPGVPDAIFCLAERSLPHSIVVDQSGRRFVNEAADYYSFGSAMRKAGLTEAWLIVDATHRSRYMFCGMLPGKTPQGLIDAGFFIKADTIDALSGKTGIDPANLKATLTRFNAMAAKGVDEDFQRGESPYEGFWNDPTVKPNGSFAPVDKGPFLAVRMLLGDLGTKGGLVTDKHSQVVGTDGQPIAGLYAAGNCTASVYGRSYPGPGATLGPAMTFAYIGANHIPA
ncbi:FAD-dependent oxidoreductase [Sphingomonas crocodyli]|uniref:FAD-dependent oxidoreductase n=1 Tax=Sphingomonas crocodyli TaxID=1979270 RepID=A0A437M9U3_9SPHN|nr:FAD-dependent oxidoreductase [Sphingomonas crocodyli]RVT94324.1 FAD-dependent oxidoreductase [Sphingomonas crocodyli]